MVRVEDARKAPLTRNATMGQKEGRNYKIGVKIRHFPHFLSNIGVETIHIFQRPKKVGFEMAEHMQ